MEFCSINKIFFWVSFLVFIYLRIKFIFISTSGWRHTNLNGVFPHLELPEHLRREVRHVKPHDVFIWMWGGKNDEVDVVCLCLCLVYFGIETRKSSPFLFKERKMTICVRCSWKKFTKRHHNEKQPSAIYSR